MTCEPPSRWDYYSSGGTAGTYTVGTRDVTDPVQGGFLPNCSLIAVLASLAWKKILIDQPQEPYTFKFYRYDQDNKVVEDSISTTGRLPLDASGKLKHAKSSTATEIWPALWEKAYYKWLEKLAGIDTDTPDYCKYDQWQSPETLLFQLTGKSLYSVKSDGKTSLNADTVFKDIDGVCDTYGRITTNRTIRAPAAAWTYASAAENPANSADPTNPVYPYSPDTAPGSLIDKRHTYSLLGVVGKKDSNANWTEKYVVLRNPYGPVLKDPSLPVGLYTVSGLWCSTNINLADNTDGIFALRADQFVNYFQGYVRTV